MLLSGTRKVRALIAGFGLLFVTGTAFADGEQSFDQGLTAYRAGDYARAAELFENARKQGLTKVSVYFNLGSSYYRLEQYDQAIPMFKRVIDSGKMTDIGYFNLGLIARKQEKSGLARKYFSKSIAASKNKKLIFLARQNIREIDNRVGVWNASAIIEGGYDDNVSNTATGVASGGDSYLTLRAYTDALLTGTREKGWSAHGEFYNRSYATISGFGLGSLSGGAKLHMPMFGQDGFLGGYYKMQTLDSAPYENISGFETGAKTRTKSGVSYDYRYRLESIDTASAYSYLQGTRQRIRFQRRSRLGKDSTLTLAYRFELNDRQNSATASYSNSRHGIRASYYKMTGDGIRWRVIARFRISDYTPVATQDRKDTLVHFSVQRLKKINDDLEWTLQYSLNHNDSTDSVYAYTSNTYQVGIRKHF